MFVLDNYTLQARAVPAIIAVAPAIALLFVTVSWGSLTVPETVAVLGIAGLIVGFADIARRRGKAFEKQMLLRLGVSPSVRCLRHSDTTIDELKKDRYRRFLAERIGEAPTTLADERTFPSRADAQYERCTTWLRENTRGEQFSLLLEENKTYGFRRNLRGLKWWGLALNIAVVIVSFAMQSGSLPWIPDLKSSEVFLICAVGVVHALYFLIAVTDRSVVDASEGYSRQLLASCELLMGKGSGPGSS